MKLVQVGSRTVFHKLFMDCLAEQRQPTEEEIAVMAAEIWVSSHGFITGQP